MDSIEGLLERPKVYNNIDGVGELGMGFMMLGFALLMWLQAHSSNGAVWHKMYVVLPFILLMGTIIDRGGKAIKERITYPRTGFVEYKKRDNVWIAAIAFVTSALVAMGLAFAARSHWGIGSHLGLTTPAALIGLVFAAAYAYGIARVARWKWAVAGAIATSSVVIAMLPAELVGAIAVSTSGAGAFSAGAVGAWLLSILTYGAILLISGAISFVLYLRHTQPPATAAA
jgi:MFS family permease